MSTDYRIPNRTGVTAYYNVDVNAFVSLFKKNLEDRSHKAVSETTIGAMIINTLVHFVIGPGLEAQASPEMTVLGWTDEQKNRFISQAESFFRMNAGSKKIDYYGKETFQTLQAIAYRNILVYGDTLLRRSYKGKLQGYAPYIQLLSGAWVRNPSGRIDDKRMTGGVEFNDSGREIAYWIAQTRDDRQDSFQSERFLKYNPKSGFEEYDLIRLGAREANQIRGIPVLSPIMEDLFDLDTFKAAYRTKAATQAVLTAVIESESEAPTPIISTVETIKSMGRQTPQALPVEDKDLGVALGSGNVIALNPGEKMHMVESQVPATDYTEYLKTELSHMGGAVGLAFEMMVQQYSSNYSASRATIAGEEKIFRDYREEFADKFCAPVWEQVIDYGIRVGAIEAPGYLDGPAYYRNAVLASTWIGPSPINIDPLKEVNSHIAAIGAGLETRERAMREMYQTDFEETIDRIRKEKEMMADLLTDTSAETSENDKGTTNEEDEEQDTGR